MSAYTHPIRRLSPLALSNLLTATNPPSLPTDLAIIDVRDSDHIGGHIRGSLHVPSSTLSHATPELVRKLQDKKRVVFHCMLSQERGPNAARKYLITRERMGLPVGVKAREGGDGEGEGEEVGQEMGQEVLVLEGGFVEWGKRFGKDVKLTEGFVAELWEGGW
ncbi:Rhodanese-like protein [Ascodesmis nigricans]|uniref:Rhodanese-like protein n=1 Tax=Ascodesmis nigricans TaxID=341454 RepID=A0A4S2N7K4_9PEZI|nr:Rhodanese-like protein [Ascodesmis nigricans]